MEMKIKGNAEKMILKFTDKIPTRKTMSTIRLNNPMPAKLSFMPGCFLKSASNNKTCPDKGSRMSGCAKDSAVCPDLKNRAYSTSKRNAD